MVDMRNITGWQLAFASIVVIGSVTAVTGALLNYLSVVVLGVIAVLVANSCWWLNAFQQVRPLVKATEANRAEHLSHVGQELGGNLSDRLDRHETWLQAEFRSMLDASLESAFKKKAHPLESADVVPDEVLKLNESVGAVTDRLEIVQKRVLNRLRSSLSTIEDSLSVMETELSAMRDRHEAGERRLLSTIEAERLLTQERFKELSETGLRTESVAGPGSEGDDVGLTESRHEKSFEAPPHSALIYETKESLGRWVDDALKENRDQLMSLIEKALRNETRQVEALWQLMPLAEARDVLPPSGRWAMDARSLLHLMNLVRTYKPKRVLELGGGTSTVWLGYACEQYGGKVVSIDHDEYFATATELNVSKHRLEDTVETRTAPLEAVEVHSTDYHWYSSALLEDLRDIDMLVVDGPPGSTSREARLPALPLLEDRLSEDCLIILDDTQREDEQRILDQWLLFYPQFARMDEGISRLGVLKRHT